MKCSALIMLVVMTFVISSVKAEGKFLVSVELKGKTISLSELTPFTHGDNLGYYFTIRASVTNRTTEKSIFMVDDECTHASWKIVGNPFQLLVGSCRQNVYEQITLDPGESYDSILKVWFPENPHVKDLRLKVGFIEIVDYKIITGPYWSDIISVEIER